MAYTFGFGIKCAAPILVLAAFATNSLVAAAPAPALLGKGVEVNLNVSGLRNMKGQLMVCLTKNPKAFPDCGKDPSAIKRRVPAAQSSTIAFSQISPGTYAAALIHDENMNNKMDLSLFLPKEGFAFSRNPTVVMGPPKFKSAEFVVGDADVRQAVKMKYML